MHIFLTGEIQVGKSTIIRKWLEAHPELKTGGFRTVAGPKNSDGSDSVHIIPAVGETPLTAENCVLQRGAWAPNRKFSVSLEVFDTIGVSLLERTEDCDLILMDEVGVQEDGAQKFSQAVLNCLDGDIPILGVVRDKPGMLTNAVRGHEKTELIVVTVENRQKVLERLLEWDGGLV